MRFTSLLQGVNFCGAWHWSDEDPRDSLFEVGCCHQYDEKDQTNF